MGYLKGFAEARRRFNAATMFDGVVASGQPWRLLAALGVRYTGIVASHTPFTFLLDAPEGQKELHKHEIELLYPEAVAAVLEPLFDIDRQVKGKKLGPILDLSQRAPLRNTLLYICQADKIPVEITVLGGLRFRGLLTDFTRFEMKVSFTPKLSVILLRHAVFSMFTRDNVDLCNPGRDETWMKTNSALWVDR